MTGRRRPSRLPKHFPYATKCGFEQLELRTLLAVGPIPDVPVPEAYWMLDDSGTVAVDSSGNGHTATLGGGASWTDGNVGTGAMTLDGSSTGVATVSGPVVDTSADFTVSAWVNLDSLSGFQTFVSIAGNNVAGFFLQLRDDTGTFAFTRLPSDATSSSTHVAASTAPELDTWYHVVGVNDSVADTLTLYVDGQSMGSVTYTSGWEATGDTLIGHGFYGGNNVDYVDGTIDEVQIFASALSAEQVVALAQPAAYSFDDGTGTTAADVSGHGNTLTLDTGASWAAPGRLGSNALSVDGTANGNATYASPVVDTSLPFSVSAWVKLDSLSGYQTIASIDGTETSAFYLQYRDDTGRFAFTRFDADSTSATSYSADAIDAPVTGQWYNLVGVNDVADGQLRLYVDGILQDTVAYSSGWEGTGATVVGAGLFDGSRTDFVDGEIDEVRFYNSALSEGAAYYIGTAGESVIDVSMGSTGITVSPMLYGAFMEDINYGGEGGIYSNEVRNSGFNDSTNALRAWAAVADSSAAATLTSDDTTGPTSALTMSGKLSSISGVSTSKRVGISNSGYFGVAVEPSTTYSAEFYAKASAGFTGPLTVSLESTGGTVYATATVSSITSSWAKYTVDLTTDGSVPVSADNLFIISTNDATANGETIWLGATYLFPPGYGGGDNHFRSDLAGWLVDLAPAFFRIPGGNYLEGVTYEDRFNWSETIGPIEDRPGHYNSAWNYWSTDGFGLDEYLQFSELMGAEPVVGVFASYTLNGQSYTGATLEYDIQDALNELHYILDPVSTEWGALRAANGHPDPYELNYVEIGNEDWASDGSYATRYPMYYDAIKADFPDLKIIAATSTNTGGYPYDVYDDHFYNSAAWFAANSDYYDNHPRNEYEVLVGEYAAREGSPTSTLAAALGEAAFLMGCERNSDVVTMTAYAPLWVNESEWQWGTDLIGFNNTTSYASPSYYVQKMLSQNRGTTLVSSSSNGFGGLQVLTTKTDTTYYLTVVNTTGLTTQTQINLVDALTVSSSAAVTTLTASASNVVNSIANPTNVAPTASTFSALDTSFSYAFPGYSLTILEFNATVDQPTVVTPAAASPEIVTGTTTDLSVLGNAIAGESNLIYTWSATGPADVSYSANGTNASKNTTATFAEAGQYEFTAAIENTTNGAITTSSIFVTVEQTSTGVAISPADSFVAAGAMLQLSTFEADQFGDPMNSLSDFDWSVASGVGSINASGLYTAPASAGSATIHVESGSGNADTNLYVVTAEAWYQANESSGTTLTDSSGSGNNAALTGSYNWVSGVGGNALSLEGGHAELPSGIVSSLDDFTVATWFYLDSLDSWSRIFDFGTGTEVNMFLTPQASGSSGPLRYAITTSGGSNEQQINGPTLSTGQWYHVAITLDGNLGTMYVNGVAVGTNANMTLSPSDMGVTSQNYLGDSQYSADPALLGRIDDFRLYGEALSAEQILNMASPIVVSPAAAADDPVTAFSTTMSVLGDDLTAGESALVYTWATTGTPPAPVLFSINDTNSAKSTVATFEEPGEYYLEATIDNPTTGLSTTSLVRVAVSPELPGDYDLDGDVDGRDFLAWQQQIHTTVPVYSGADGSGDGYVDADDLAVWRTNFGASALASPASAATAEPTVVFAAVEAPVVKAVVETSVVEAVTERADESPSGLAEGQAKHWAAGGVALAEKAWTESAMQWRTDAPQAFGERATRHAVRDEAIADLPSWRLPAQEEADHPMPGKGEHRTDGYDADFAESLQEDLDRVFDLF